MCAKCRTKAMKTHKNIIKKNIIIIHIYVYMSLIKI